MSSQLFKAMYCYCIGLKFDKTQNDIMVIVCTGNRHSSSHYVNMEHNFSMKKILHEKQTCQHCFYILLPWWKVASIWPLPWTKDPRVGCDTALPFAQSCITITQSISPIWIRKSSESFGPLGAKRILSWALTPRLAL